MAKSILKTITTSFLIICFLSCSSSKNQQITNEDLLLNSIDDFIKEYNLLKNAEKLEAITIYINKKGINKSISISNMPKETFDSSNHKSKGLIGKYKNLLFEFYGIENFNSKSLLSNEKIDLTIKQSEQSNKILLEFNPSLEIDYNYEKKTKKLRLFNSEIRNEKWNGKVSL